MRRIVALMALSAGWLVIVPATAEACTCGPGRGPACEATWASPLVFAGTVTAIEPQGPPQAPLAQTRVRFRVSEAFRGVDAPEVDLHLGDSSCNPVFHEGESYLVYGSHQSGVGWTTTSCSGTKPLRDAKEDLAYLRLPDEKKGPSRVIGEVLYLLFDTSSSGGGLTRLPVRNMPVRVTDGSMQAESLTDGEGKFSIEVRPHRSYRVTFGSVDGLVVTSDYPVWIPDHRACASVTALAQFDGRVSGVVEDARGQPIPFMPLFLRSSPVSVSALERATVSDVLGRFQFRGVQPARYVIAASGGPPRQAYRAPELQTAAPVIVGSSARMDVGSTILREPDRAVLIDGLVLDEGGRPVPNVSVSVRRTGAYPGLTEDLRTDGQGAFRVSVIAGQPYEFDARSSGRDATGEYRLEAKAAITRADETTSVRLRLARRR